MYNLIKFPLTIAVIAWLTCVSQTMAASYPKPETLAGTFDAHALYVIDGDSIKARIRIWLDQDIVTTIRIRGIDAPEIRGKCESEKMRAQQAKTKLQELLREQKLVLTNVERDKFGGRVVADVATEEKGEIAPLLIAENLARPYFGDRRKSWCGQLVEVKQNRQIAAGVRKAQQFE